MTYTFDENCFSDLYKDAYGFRPGSNFFERLESASDDEKQQIWNDLIADLEESIERENLEQEHAISKFKSKVESLLTCSTSATPAIIISWLMDAENVKGDYEFFEYLNGLPYGFIKKTYQI